MPNELNHIIVHCRDRRESAAFLAELLGGPAPCDWGLFTQVDTANNVEGEINHLFGGRGVYALDPGGTVLT
ncbi:hypothetical protein [Streptomyces sp. NPDC057381]|uniref:hypothetical protein n=1 Tax=Streptomyces sp. NPDC057381 TaxID=3346111 RepID=UPI00362AC46B